MAAYDHLITLLAFAFHLDELAAAPRAWPIVEPHLALLGWPKPEPFPKPGSEVKTGEAQMYALICAQRLGKDGQSLTRANVVECLIGKLPQDLVEAVVDTPAHTRWAESEPAATAALREALTRACQHSVSSRMASSTRHVSEGTLPVSAAVEQLAKLTASIPGQQIALPAPEGRAYREHFARAAKRRLILTGLEGIDEAIAGFAPGDYVGVAARSNVGKTAFLLALARAQIFPDAGRNWLVDESLMEARLVPQSDKSTATDVLLLSLEMTGQSVRERLMFDLLNVNATAWRRCPDEAIATSDLASTLGIDGYLDAFESAAATLTIVDASVLGGRATSQAVDAAISTWAADRRVANPNATLLVLVDYWQKVEPLGNDVKSTKQQQLSDVSKVLARAAKRENVALVCAAQIGRAADNHEPNESELRESGDLLIDADVVMLLHAASPAQRARLTNGVSIAAMNESVPEPEPEPATKKKGFSPRKRTATVSGLLPPNDFQLAHDTMLVIGGKGRDVQAGWKVPLYFGREYQRLVDGWPCEKGWRNPFEVKEITAIMK